MKVHSSKSSTIAKKLWNLLRINFIMMRKGLISKKKLIMHINLFFKLGKLIRKSFTNFLHLHHHQRHHHMTRANFSQREYEFSCNNSPNPVFFHMSSAKRHNYYHQNHHHRRQIRLPCMNPPHVFEDLESRDGENIDHVEEYNNALVVVPKTPEYTFNLRLDGYDNVSPGENCSPLLLPFPRMISDYLFEDEIENSEGNLQVDHEAEEFIKKFYDQLRAQNRVQLLQY